MSIKMDSICRFSSENVYLMVPLVVMVTPGLSIVVYDVLFGILSL
jgi:hypothetical protein